MLAPKFERLRAFMLAGEPYRGIIVRRFIFGEALDVAVVRVHEIEAVVQQVVSPTDNQRERDNLSLRRQQAD